jgi:hypothetical protein
MPTQPIPPFHNPNNLTPSDYGASDGWRLLRVSELDAPPANAQFTSTISGWFPNAESPIRSLRYTYRTRQPDPFAAYSWVKMSERKPVKADLPLFRHREIDGHTWLANSLICYAGSTHWMHATVPAPPARELTQAEKDNAAHKAWMDSELYPVTSIEGFRAGVAYERARTAAK